MGSDHDGGYGKPPRHSQFKKGQSGNSKGRPKGSRNFSTDLKETLEKTDPHHRSRQGQNRFDPACGPDAAPRAGARRGRACTRSSARIRPALQRRRKWPKGPPG